MVTDADSAIWFQLKVVRGQSTENRVVKAAPGTSVKNLLAHELPECTIPRVTGKTKAGSGEVDMDGDVVKGLQKEYAIVRPICNSCLESGKRPVTRNALAQKRKF
jgi:hypothetical protein